MISVCMATYNGERFIREQLDSILVQLSPEDELIISDDGSNDSTLDIIKSYKDSRIKLYNFDRDKSYYRKSSYLVTTNFENALLKASGDYIFLSDQDDVWLPGKVDACKEKLHSYDLVIHDSIVVNSKLETLYHSYFDFINIKRGFLSNFIKIKYLGCCMCFNRKILDYVIPFTYNVSHDTWIALLSELSFKVYLLRKPFLLYRRHGKNISMASNKSTNPLWYKIYYRIPMLYKVFFRFVKNNML